MNVKLLEYPEAFVSDKRYYGAQIASAKKNHATNEISTMQAVHSEIPYQILIISSEFGLGGKRPNLEYIVKNKITLSFKVEVNPKKEGLIARNIRMEKGMCS